MQDGSGSGVSNNGYNFSDDSEADSRSQKPEERGEDDGGGVSEEDINGLIWDAPAVGHHVRSPSLRKHEKLSLFIFLTGDTNYKEFGFDISDDEDERRAFEVLKAGSGASKVNSKSKSKSANCK